jgi:hypothetical protein
MKKYAIFKMSANGQGGYDLCDMTSSLEPTEDEIKVQEFCKNMNKFKPDNWHYFKVFEINKNGQALSPNTGDVIRF